jgi:uncharacterized protein (TIGR00290 family)
MTVPAVMFWSGGKDSALALDRVRRSGSCEVAALVTTINPEYGRVSMHGVRQELAASQAEAAGLPFVPMEVPSSGSNAEYVASLKQVLQAQKHAGIHAVVFGDIFLEDLRAWREGFLRDAGLEGVFPLWGEDTRALSREFVERGFKAVTCCVDDAHLDETFVGVPLDAAFFAALPDSVDPCGENGEYHSFVHDGPIFARPAPFRLGERVYRPVGSSSMGSDQDGDRPIITPSAPAGSRTQGFWFVDLLPA